MPDHEAGLHLVRDLLAELAEVDLARLVGAVLRPHHRVHRELAARRAPPEDLADAGVLVGLEAERRERLLPLGRGRRVVDGVCGRARRGGLRGGGHAAELQDRAMRNRGAGRHPSYRARGRLRRARAWVAGIWARLRWAVDFSLDTDARPDRRVPRRCSCSRSCSASTTSSSSRSWRRKLPEGAAGQGPQPRPHARDARPRASWSSSPAGSSRSRKTSSSGSASASRGRTSSSSRAGCSSSTRP